MSVLDFGNHKVASCVGGNSTLSLCSYSHIFASMCHFDIPPVSPHSSWPQLTYLIKDLSPVHPGYVGCFLNSLLVGWFVDDLPNWLVGELVAWCVWQRVTTNKSHK